MNILADECCNQHLVLLLRESGHNVSYVAESNSSEPDDAVLQMAYDENRLLLTEDKDFGELVFRQKLPSHGIVLLRFDPLDSDLKVARTLSLFQESGNQLINHFTVIEPKSTRSRRLTVTP